MDVKVVASLQARDVESCHDRWALNSDAPVWSLSLDATGSCRPVDTDGLKCAFKSAAIFVFDIEASLLSALIQSCDILRLVEKRSIGDALLEVLL